MRDSTIIRNYSKQLLLCALVLLLVAYIADCALDSLIFGDESLTRQILHPTAQELAIRGLFSVFIVLITLLALHFLRKSTLLERALRKRNEELLVTNQELEAFNYALAHDLRNSLTIVYTSMEMLRDHCQIGKNTQCHFLLSTICKYSEKMETQIDGMLILSSAARKGLLREDVMLDELAREIADELLHSREKHRPTIKIANNLSANCNRNLLRIALENLLSNAIKFIPEDRPGEIEIGRLEQNGETVFFVRDNGIGFDNSQANSLFEAFNRLPESGSLPGSGIGLSTVRRIVERHAGKIWAEGVPGEGATFFFTLAPSP
jgi:signal transduction histidine kinase